MNYKRLGDYIIERVEFNVGNKYDLLQGVSNNKYFQKAKTNTIGIDLSKYRVAHNNQFVFNRATTRNGDKISIALRKGESCIVSPSYRIFEVCDENVLNPDYLQLWFSRPEFDRYARFKSHGSAHEFFDMGEMEEVELPIPSIEKQLEIVGQYQAIRDKIKVNEQICEKLEATAQTLYKQWFVDFEFPNDEGLPYKSSGGVMEYNEELEKEVPVGWEVGKLRDICKVLNGFAFDSDFYSFEKGIKVLRGENVTERALRWDTLKYYQGEMNIRIEKCFLKTDDIVIGMDGSKVGKNWSLVGEYELPMIVAQRVATLRSENQIQNFIYQSLINLNFEYYCSQVHTGTSIPHISSKQIEDFTVLVPYMVTIKNFESTIKKFRRKVYNFSHQNEKLTHLQSLLLSRLATLEGETK